MSFIEKKTTLNGLGAYQELKLTTGNATILLD